MKIRELFERDINRQINGVVKVNQEKDEVIYQELDEYVVTRELLGYFRRMFEAYGDSLQHKTDKIGVWVSGFFGSGKSHFIKILSYLLRNYEAVNDGSKRRAVSFFDGKIDDASLLADIKRSISDETDVILFNIDSKADSADRERAILNVFMKVFNEMQGFCGEIPKLAELERFLSGKGLYDQFKEKFKEKSGSNWIDERDAFMLTPDDALKAFAEVTNQTFESAQAWYNESESSENLSIEKFSKLVKNYLDGKSDKHRIVFLIDEVGQFIGTNTQLMLNLQTLAEDLGNTCEGRAWIIVTSQEDIDVVLGEVNASRSNDFSKIQARFPTRISLSASNTDEVIKHRILNKTPDAENMLKALYKKNRDIINNQISFSSDNPTLPVYRDERDFIEAYPFVGYQFPLLQKVFEAIRKHGASGRHLSQGERSMLDAFQIATQKVQEESEGILVPFYNFYQAIEGFLDSVVIRTIASASDNTSLDEFDVNMLRTLFMIRYTDLIKGNIENLTTLAISHIDDDKIVLRSRIADSLAKLEKENLVKRNGDLYYFLTNEEQDINREIKQVDVLNHEVSSHLMDIIFVDILQNNRKHRYSGNKMDYTITRVCDGVIKDTSASEIQLIVISPLNEDYEMWNNFKCNTETADGSCKIIIKLPDSKDLAAELNTYLRTVKYIRNTNTQDQSEGVKNILRFVGEENRERLKRLRLILEELFTQGVVYIAGIEAKLPNTESALTRQRDAIDYLIDNTFNKLCYLQYNCDNFEGEVKAILTTPTTPGLNLDPNSPDLHSNAKAFNEIKEYLKLKFDSNEKVVLKNLTDRFIRYPWGWPENDVVVMVAHLFRHKDVRLSFKTDPLDFTQAVDPLIKTRYWAETVIHPVEALDPALVAKSAKIAKECFHSMPPSNTDQLEEYLKERIHDTTEQLREWKTEADIAAYPTQKLLDRHSSVFQDLCQNRNSADFFRTFVGHEDTLMDFAEDYQQIESFHKNQKTVYKQARDFYDRKQQNSSYYDGDAASAWTNLQRTLTADNPYSQIPKLKTYLATIKNFDEHLIKEKRAEYLPTVDQQLKQLTEETEKIGVPNVEKVVEPLIKIRNKMDNSSSVDSILAANGQLSAAFDLGHAELQRQIEAMEQPPPAPLKPTVTISASQCIDKAYLETDTDVDDFVAKLGSKLKDAVKEGKKVRIN